MNDNEDGIFFSVCPSFNEYLWTGAWILWATPKCPYRRKGYRCTYRLPYRLLDEKMRFSCTCKNKNCYRSFDPDVIIDHRLTMRENDKLFNWQNWPLIGKIGQCYTKSTIRCKSNASERKKFKYSFLDILAAVCEDAVIFIHDIGNKAFKNSKQHYKVNGIEPRIHGHKGSRAPKAISFNDILNVVKFIKSMFCLRVIRWFLAHMYEVQRELLQSPRSFVFVSASAFPAHCDKVLFSSFSKVHISTATHQKAFIFGP